MTHHIDSLRLRVALERCKSELRSGPEWDDEDVTVRAGDIRALVDEIEGAWLPCENAPTKEVNNCRVLVQLLGNDKWDRRTRVMPGYFEEDGQAIAIDESGLFPFNAKYWKPLARTPRRD